MTGGPRQAADFLGLPADAEVNRVVAVPFTGDWHHQVTLPAEAGRCLGAVPVQH